MAKLTVVSGMSKVISNIAKSRLSTAAGFERGLKRGGLFLQRKSMEIVPIDLGPLRASAFTRKIKGGGFTTDVVVGYTTEYAVYVHEDLQARHKPGKQAKYLEAPARRFRKEILGIIRKDARRI